MKDEIKKEIVNIISWTVFLIVLICSLTLIWLNSHPYPMNFDISMDDNTLRAFEIVDNQSKENNCITSHLLHYSRSYEFDINEPLMLFNGDCACMTSTNNYTWFEDIEVL